MREFKISILTSSISRNAGGLLESMRGLYGRLIGVFDMSLYSYEDNWSSEDIKGWGGIDMNLFKSRNIFQYSKPLKDSVIRNQPNLLHVHGLWRYPHFLIHALKKKTQIVTVCTPHGMLDKYILDNQGEMKRLLGRILFKNAFRSTDCFHALCAKELEDIRAYGIHQPIAVIPNGINLPSNYHDYPKNGDGLNHLLYLGRIHPKKGLDLLIRAIYGIKQNKPHLLDGWVIDIVGWDHENTEEGLVSMVAQFELKDSIVFHGSKFGNEKAEMFAGASALILPSHGEGLPMTILEAWSWRLPVIMTEYCNLPEGFSHEAAIKIDTNIESVMSGIEELLRMTDDDRKKMGYLGYKLVEQEFTWDEVARKMLILYNWLLKGGEKPSFVNMGDSLR